MAQSRFIITTCLFTLIALAVLCGVASGADTPEYWAQINKDGHARNSNARSVQGNLRPLWARAFRNFTLIDQKSGQRSNNLCIRDGRILLITPASPVDAGYSPINTNHCATYGIYSLADGTLAHSILSPQRGGGGLIAGGGIMDSDTAAGLVNVYWQDDGVVFTGHGSDHSGFFHFNAYNSEVPFGSPQLFANDPYAWTTANANCSGYFSKSNSNRYIFARGGAGSHSPTGEYGGTGLFGPGISKASTIESMKMYSSFVVEGDRSYSFYLTNIKTQTEGYGVKITAYTPSAGSVDWVYKDPNKGFLCFGMNHCGGAPRAFCMGEDGRIYYYGYNTTGTGTTQLPNFSQGMVLVGVRNGVADVSVPISYNPQAESGSPPGYLAIRMVPQIASIGKYVVVFQPQQQDGINGHVFCVDTMTKTMWRCDFPAQYFTTNSQPGADAVSPEQAVQMVIAGDSAYVVEPSVVSGALRLRVEKMLLATGARTTTVVNPVDVAGQPIAANTGAVISLREVAAVDGRLVCLVDLGRTTPTYGVADQVLVVIGGDAAPAPDYPPVAVISAPVTGVPMAQIKTDYPDAPTNRFDSGTIIAFSSAGSSDPDGGALTYLWNFGDASTSTLANPTHTYASSAPAPTVTQRTVTLTVTDNEGNVAQATKVLAIRNVGGVEKLALSSEADAYVDPSVANAGRNYGSDPLLQTYGYYQRRTYVRFSLSTVVAPVQSATLRLFTRTQNIPAGSSLNRLFARECSNNWGETTITSNNAPAAGNVCGASLSKSYPQFSYYLDIPVTEYVQRSMAAGKVSFALEMPDVDSALIADSREGGQGPQLIIERGSSGYAAPTITAQPQDITIPSAMSIVATGPLGEAALTYQWLTLSGPGQLTFGTNNSNAAKTTSVSATTAGTYAVRCDVSDGLQIVSSRVATVTVKPVGTSGVAVGWGNNQYGQLGDGTTAARLVPVDIFAAANVKAFSCGNGHTLALLNDGTVMAWGDNTYGQLGIGTNISMPTPVVVSGLSGVRAIAAGGYHSLALMNDGTVRAWGYNGYGEVGDGTFATRSRPVALAGVTNVRTVKGGAYHSFAVLNDGSVLAWGRNQLGQLGTGSGDRNTPTVIPGLNGVVDAAGGLSHSIFIHGDGTASACGSNNSGQLGDGTPSVRLSPVKMLLVSNAKAVACGQAHTLLVMRDGTVRACGSNAHGELGIAGSALLDARPIPGLTNVLAVAAGWYHSVALTADGRIKAWGDNSVGQLGDNKAEAVRSSPADVPSLSNMLFAAAGGHQTLAIPAAGGVNQPPVITTFSPETPFAITVGATRKFSVVAFDLEGTALSYAWRLDQQPLASTASTMNFTATATQVGVHTIEVTVTDAQGASAKQSWNTTVRSTNTPPVATAAAISTNEDTAATITLAGSDAESQPLTFSVVTQPAHGTLSGTAPNLRYTPAANYNGADSFTFRVNDGESFSTAAAISISVVPVDDPPSISGVPAFGTATTMNVGATQVFAVNASDPDGDALDYAWKVNGATVSGATGRSFNFTPTAAGSYSVSVTVHSGNTWVMPPAWPVTVTVVSVMPTTTTLASSANPIVYGSGVTLTASVTPATATGSVSFRDGGTVLGTVAISAGKAIFTAPTLNAGTHNLTASYAGSSTNGASASAVLSQVVNKRATTTAIASSLNPSITGQAVTFTATIAPSTATGTVTFQNGVTTLGQSGISGGKAILTTAKLPVGARSITAIFSGDANHAGSTSAAMSQVIAPNSPPVIASPASASPATVGVNQTVAFTVAATDQDSDPVTYLWNYGDGTTDSTAQHSYTAIGDYSVSVQVSDGQHAIFSETIVVSVVAGASTTEPNEVHQMLTIASFKATLKAGNARDTVSLVGSFDVAAGDFPFIGQQLRLNIGGLEYSFTLDRKGRGKPGNAAIALKRVRHGERSELQFRFASKRASAGEAWGLNELSSSVSLPVGVIMGNAKFFAGVDAILSGASQRKVLSFP